MNWYKELLLNIGWAALQIAMADPILKPKVKPIALKIFRGIKAAFIGDPDFQ
jgi:hypothetical protein